MTYINDLKTSRNSAASALADAMANPQPNYTVDGRSIAWSEYRTSLVEQLTELNDLIIKAAGAVEISTIGLG